MPDEIRVLTGYTPILELRRNVEQFAAVSLANGRRVLVRTERREDANLFARMADERAPVAGARHCPVCGLLIRLQSRYAFAKPIQAIIKNSIHILHELFDLNRRRSSRSRQQMPPSHLVDVGAQLRVVATNADALSAGDRRRRRRVAFDGRRRRSQQLAAFDAADGAAWREAAASSASKLNHKFVLVGGERAASK